MGQWAQRSRRGGKATPITVLAKMATAVKIADTTARVSWNQNAPIALLDPADFESLPGAGDEIDNIFPNRADINFDDDIIIGQEIQYTGSTPGFLPNDSIEIAAP